MCGRGCSRRRLSRDCGHLQTAGRSEPVRLLTCSRRASGASGDLASIVNLSESAVSHQLRLLAAGWCGAARGAYGVLLARRPSCDRPSPRHPEARRRSSDMSEACCAPPAARAHAGSATREAAADSRARRELWLAGISGVLLGSGIAAGAIGFPNVRLVCSLATVALSIASPFRHAIRSPPLALDINCSWCSPCRCSRSVISSSGVCGLAVRRRRLARGGVSFGPPRHPIARDACARRRVVRRDARESRFPSRPCGGGHRDRASWGARGTRRVVMSGRSTVNQAPITGSRIDKELGAEICRQHQRRRCARSARHPRGWRQRSRIWSNRRSADALPVQTFVERFARRYRRSRFSRSVSL